MSHSTRVRPLALSVLRLSNVDIEGDKICYQGLVFEIFVLIPLELRTLRSELASPIILFAVRTYSSRGSELVLMPYVENYYPTITAQ